jgi:hypothetical protein
MMKVIAILGSSTALMTTGLVAAATLLAACGSTTDSTDRGTERTSPPKPQTSSVRPKSFCTGECDDTEHECKSTCMFRFDGSEEQECEAGCHDNALSCYGQCNSLPPVILGDGLGCDSNQCIWVVGDNFGGEGMCGVDFYSSDPTWHYVTGLGGSSVNCAPGSYYGHDVATLVTPAGLTGPIYMTVVNYSTGKWSDFSLMP